MKYLLFLIATLLALSTAAQDVARKINLNQVKDGTTIEVDQTFVLGAALSGDCNDNANLGTTLIFADTGLSLSGDIITNTVDCKYLDISINVFIDMPLTPTQARINPNLQLLKNGVEVDKAGMGYMRHATGHTSTSLPLNWRDLSPAIGDTYEVRGLQGSARTGVAQGEGFVNVTAVKKVIVRN